MEFYGRCNNAGYQRFTGSFGLGVGVGGGGGGVGSGLSQLSQNFNGKYEAKLEFPERLGRGFRGDQVKLLFYRNWIHGKLAQRLKMSSGVSVLLSSCQITGVVTCLSGK